MTPTRPDLLVDGVVTIHAPSEDTVTQVRLCFAVGSRDEVLSEQGVLHMLEHLAMHAVARESLIEVNASVGPSRTEFSGSGPAALVVDHLDRLCRALADPPVERMADEAPVVAAEIDGDEGPHHALLAARYGFRDLGSSSVVGPGPDGLRPEQVRAAAGRWFVRQNAVLLVEGPLPPDLRLPLADGPVPTHVRVAPRRRPGPAALTLDGPACLVSLLLPPPDPQRLDELTVELVRQRLLDVVRHEKGLTYALDDELFVDVPHGSGGRGSDFMIGADPLEARLVPAVQAFVRTVLGLLGHGPRPEELDRARERLALAAEGRRAALERDLDQALDRLVGTGLAVGDRPATTVEERTVTAYLQRLAGDALFALPDHPELDLAELGLQPASPDPLGPGPLPPGRRFRPPRLARAISSSARRAELCLTDDGLHVMLEGEVQSVRWADVVGVLEEDEHGHELAVFGADGATLVVGDRVWRGGEVVTAALRANVPAGLVYRRSGLLSSPEE